VDYSDFGPGDYFVGNETLSGGQGGDFGKLDLTGSGSFLVADGSLTGVTSIQTNIAIDPFIIPDDPSYQITGLGNDPDWYTQVPTLYSVACQAESAAIPTPAITAAFDSPAHSQQSLLWLAVASILGLGCMAIIIRRVAQTTR
jgi:hypothetical protein